jgi:NitT/TauT family transport system substrate-binding protein
MRQFLRRREFCLGLLATPALVRSASAQEAPLIRIVKQQGLGYLPQMVMEREKLVEKHAERAGLKDLKIEWQALGGTGPLIDGILTGNIHFAITGAPALATLWDKTAGTPQEVRALCAVHSLPFVLVTRNPDVKTLKDFTETDRIAVPAVKVSAQAVMLQMAAAQIWGMAEYTRFDRLTVTLPHPDAMASVLTPNGPVNSHYSIAPFYHRQLAAPGVHRVVKSHETIGGKHVNGVLLVAKRFYDANPKISAAVLAAQDEANGVIRAEPRKAAEIYLAASNDKRSSLDDMTAIIADPDNDYTTTPLHTMKFAEFMHAVGSLKRKPESWKDLYFPAIHGLAGS